MLTGWYLLAVFLLGVTLIVLLTSKFKVHPFLAMFFSAILVGLGSGIDPTRMVDLIVSGFSSVLGFIAVIIVSATIIGELMEKTGATLVISRAILRLVGRDRSPLAMSLAGYAVGMPVMCCDTAFIILSPLAKALSAGSGYGLSLFSLALAAGTLTSFKLIFPAAPLFPTTVFEADVTKVMLLGGIASIPTLIIGLFLAYRLGQNKSNQVSDKKTEGLEELAQKYDHLPSLPASFAALLVPIILIIIRSLMTNWLSNDSLLKIIFNFIGHPVVALPIGIGLALTLAYGKPMDEVNSWVSKGIQKAAGIMVIVGAGGVLGKVLQETGIGSFLGNSVLGLGVPALLVVFLISALIKTGQGSSMVTMVTAPAIILPILPSLNISPVLAAMAVSAGAIVCVNINDSFFWVTTGFSETDVSTGYRTITVMSVVMGLVALAAIALAAPLIGI